MNSSTSLAVFLGNTSACFKGVASILIITKKKFVRSRCMCACFFYMCVRETYACLWPMHAYLKTADCCVAKAVILEEMANADA